MTLGSPLTIFFQQFTGLNGQQRIFYHISHSRKINSWHIFVWNAVWIDFETIVVSIFEIYFKFNQGFLEYL